MRQKPHDLRRRLRCSQRAFEDRGAFRNRGFVLRRLELPALALPGFLNEVVNQANAVAGPDRQRLVFAVGIERGVGKLGEFGGTRIYGDFAARMPNPQFAAAMRRRQRDDQSAEHPVGLLRVPMRQKETLPVVHQQLVKLGRHGHALAAQAGAHFRENGLEVRRPGFATDPDLAKSDLPDLAYGSIDDSLLTSAVRRALRLPHERRDLCFGNGERQRSHAIDVHLRHRHLHRAADEKVAMPLHA